MTRKGISAKVIGGLEEEKPEDVDTPPGADAKDKDKPFFVHILVGPDNYKYMGFLPDKERPLILIAGKNGMPAAPSFKALQWVFMCINKDKVPADLKIFHEGTCGKCGRELTVPESIQIGIGPVCLAQMTV